MAGRCAGAGGSSAAALGRAVPIGRNAARLGRIATAGLGRIAATGRSGAVPARVGRAATGGRGRAAAAGACSGSAAGLVLGVAVTAARLLLRRRLGFAAVAALGGRGVLAGGRSAGLALVFAVAVALTTSTADLLVVLVGRGVMPLGRGSALLGVVGLPVGVRRKRRRRSRQHQQRPRDEDRHPDHEFAEQSWPVRERLNERMIQNATSGGVEDSGLPRRRSGQVLRAAHVAERPAQRS